HRLLALDHERREPWGPHHGLNVACYCLQHPSTAPAAAAGGQWTLIEAYETGGLDAVNRVEQQRVAQNRRGRFEPEPALRAPDRVRPARFTIEDLSVDGSFPADGYEQRMLEWVRSI